MDERERRWRWWHCLPVDPSAWEPSILPTAAVPLIWRASPWGLAFGPDRLDALDVAVLLRCRACGSPTWLGRRYCRRCGDDVSGAGGMLLVVPRWIPVAVRSVVVRGVHVVPPMARVAASVMAAAFVPAGQCDTTSVALAAHHAAAQMRLAERRAY